MNQRSIIGTVVVVLGLAAVVGGLSWWKLRAMNAPKPPAFEPPQTVQLVTVRSGTWQQTAKLVGSVFALQSITLSNEVAGTVKDVLFESGTVVEQGQVLLTMDTSTEQADLDAALATVKVAEAGITVQEARVTSARAAVALAESDSRRIGQAVDARAAAENARDRATADLARSQAELAEAIASSGQASSQLEQAKARAAQLRAVIAKKTLRAPFKARVGIRNVHPGQYLAEGTTMVWLQGIADETYLDFAIPQDQAWRVQVGQVVMARSESLGAEPTPIRIVAIDAAVDRGTRNVRIRSIVPNPGERLRPGTYVDVEVPIDAPHECILIPDTAVRRASYGDHVWVIIPGEKPGELRAKQRFVKLGQTTGSDVIVAEGLKAGEQIAAAGSFKLRDGAPVAGGEAPPPKSDPDAHTPPTPGDKAPADHAEKSANAGR